MFCSSCCLSLHSIRYVRVCAVLQFCFLKVCSELFLFLRQFVILSPKGKTLDTVSFLITSQIEWYKLCSLSTYCTEVTALYLQSCIMAKISAYAFSVHFLLIIAYNFKGTIYSDRHQEEQNIRLYSD